ncbi:HAMP domain-containing sensor histidine kinase [Mangrovibacterium marinum]|uniref:sensor histidine kinase n=1 Tax=Mangrovibacterium marinum TaxID=1639118 RepID=UPI002A18CC95|nr:HAMP domain-containing sensor histidine kinase [Mangrovibacterium marinum]
MIFTSKQITLKNLIPACCALLFGLCALLAIAQFAPSGLIANGEKIPFDLLTIAAIIIAILFGTTLGLGQKIRSIRKENKTTLSAVNAVIAVINNKKQVVQIVQCDHKLLQAGRQPCQGDSLQQFFKHKHSPTIEEHADRCFQSRETVNWDYSISLEDQTYFYHGQLVYQSPNRAVFSAYDITQQKRSEERFKNSANEVQEMNDVKDQFFSIIAHDLRSPVGSFKMLTGMLLHNFGKNDPETTKQMLSSIHLASSNLYDLLENLLSWSHNQRKSLRLNLQSHSLYDLVDDAIDSQLVHSELKNIQIINALSLESYAICDQYVTLTVIRNLISNALKFTLHNGEIQIRCDQHLENNQPFRLISVSDNGIGIDPEKLKTIFNFNPNKSTLGTNSESGSGLGLILCKELIEKQGGFIRIVSTLGKGTVVSFGLPASVGAPKATILQEQVFLS